MQIELETALLEQLRNITPRQADMLALSLEQSIDDWNEPEQTEFRAALRAIKEVAE